MAQPAADDQPAATSRTPRFPGGLRFELQQRPTASERLPVLAVAKTSKASTNDASSSSLLAIHYEARKASGLSRSYSPVFLAASPHKPLIASSWNSSSSQNALGSKKSLAAASTTLTRLSYSDSSTPVYGQQFQQQQTGVSKASLYDLWREYAEAARNQHLDFLCRGKSAFLDLDDPNNSAAVGDSLERIQPPLQLQRQNSILGRGAPTSLGGVGIFAPSMIVPNQAGGFKLASQRPDVASTKPPPITANTITNRNLAEKSERIRKRLLRQFRRRQEARKFFTRAATEMLEAEAEKQRKLEEAAKNLSEEIAAPLTERQIINEPANNNNNNTSRSQSRNGSVRTANRRLVRRESTIANIVESVNEQTTVTDDRITLIGSEISYVFVEKNKNSLSQTSSHEPRTDNQSRVTVTIEETVTINRTVVAEVGKIIRLESSILVSAPSRNNSATENQSPPEFSTNQNDEAKMITDEPQPQSTTDEQQLKSIIEDLPSELQNLDDLFLDQEQVELKSTEPTTLTSQSPGGTNNAAEVAPAMPSVTVMQPYPSLGSAGDEPPAAAAAANYAPAAALILPARDVCITCGCPLAERGGKGRSSNTSSNSSKQAPSSNSTNSNSYYGSGTGLSTKSALVNWFATRMTCDQMLMVASFEDETANFLLAAQPFAVLNSPSAQSTPCGWLPNNKLSGYISVPAKRRATGSQQFKDSPMRMNFFGYRDSRRKFPTSGTFKHYNTAEEHARYYRVQFTVGDAGRYAEMWRLSIDPSAPLTDPHRPVDEMLLYQTSRSFTISQTFHEDDGANKPNGQNNKPQPNNGKMKTNRDKPTSSDSANSEQESVSNKASVGGNGNGPNAALVMKRTSDAYAVGSGPLLMWPAGTPPAGAVQTNSNPPAGPWPIRPWTLAQLEGKKVLSSKVSTLTMWNRADDSPQNVSSGLSGPLTLQPLQNSSSQTSPSGNGPTVPGSQPVISSGQQPSSSSSSGGGGGGGNQPGVAHLPGNRGPKQRGVAQTLPTPSLEVQSIMLREETEVDWAIINGNNVTVKATYMSNSKQLLPKGGQNRAGGSFLVDGNGSRVEKKRSKLLASQLSPPSSASEASIILKALRDPYYRSKDNKDENNRKHHRHHHRRRSNQGNNLKDLLPMDVIVNNREDEALLEARRSSLLSLSVRPRTSNMPKLSNSTATVLTSLPVPTTSNNISANGVSLKADSNNNGSNSNNAALSALSKLAVGPTPTPMNERALLMPSRLSNDGRTFLLPKNQSAPDVSLASSLNALSIIIDDENNRSPSLLTTPNHNNSSPSSLINSPKPKLLVNS